MGSSTACILLLSAGLAQAAIALLDKKDGSKHRLVGREQADGYFRLVWDKADEANSASLWNSIAALRFALIWIELWALAALLAGASLWYLYVAGSVYAGCRLRALQEISHYSIHGRLCRSRKWGKSIADLFFHYPAVLPASDDRFRHHVLQHHRFSNLPERDPNLDDLRSAGIEPGLGFYSFAMGCVFPVTPRGLLTTVSRKLRLQLSLFMDDRPEFFVRLAVISIVAAAMIAIEPVAAIWLYAVPVLVVHPLLAWLSQLLEHRWFSPAPSRSDWRREYAVTSALTLPGFGNRVLRWLILPYGDSYHLAHSLYPHARWNLLPIIDSELRSRDPHYLTHEVVGLFWGHRSGLRALWRLLRAPRRGIVAT